MWGIVLRNQPEIFARSCGEVKRVVWAMRATARLLLDRPVHCRRVQRPAFLSGLEVSCIHLIRIRAGYVADLQKFRAILRH
jgi:hypothetical protein